MSSPPGPLRRFAPTPPYRPRIWGLAPPLAGPNDRRFDTRSGDEPGDPAARPRHPGGPCLLRPDRGAPRCGSHSSGGKRVRTARAERGGKVDAAQRDQWADAAHCRRGGDRRQAGGEAVDPEAGPDRVVLHSRGPRYLPQPHGEREPEDLDLPGWTQCEGGRGADLRHLPPAGGTTGATGRDHVRGRTADAGHLEGAGNGPEGTAPGRIVDGSGPVDRL